MIISSLKLTSFRHWRKNSFEFDPRTTLIAGPNGAGKTNILEAIYLLATGASWRTEDVGEMVNFDAEVAHINGFMAESAPGSRPDSGGETIKPRRHELGISLTRGLVGGRKAAKIHYKAEGAAKRKSDFIGRLKVVLFEPESLEIVIGDPRNRRRFLDEVLSQTDREYTRSLQAYAKALRIRNKLLDRIRDGQERAEMLAYWERTLIKHGTLIQAARQGLIEWLNGQLNSNVSKHWSNRTGSETLFGRFRTSYLPNIISQDRLDQYRGREILAGHTFVGPQRDELKILMAMAPSRAANDSAMKLLSSFGSRGEQRMAVLQLKLLEARWIEEKTGEESVSPAAPNGPVILLDDIFSELDSEREEMVGELVKGRQAIMTATEIHRGHYPEAKVVKLE